MAMISVTNCDWF